MSDKPHSSWDLYGVKTRWEHELESVSKGGLLFMIRILLETRGYFTGAADQAKMLEFLRNAKEAGRTHNLCASIDRMNKDPRGEYLAHKRRQRSAKAAARRRKTEARRKKKEA